MFIRLKLCARRSQYAKEKSHPNGWLFSLCRVNTMDQQTVQNMREYSASKAGSVPPRQLFCQTDKTVCAMRRRCASHRIAGRSNHRFIAGSVLQKEMPSEWMASLFGAGYGNRTRLCGLGSDRSTDELTLHIKLLEQGTGILRRLRRLRVPAHFLLALPKAAMPCIAPSYDGKMLVIEPAFRGLEDTAFCR